jgi:hypothetical protein
VSTSPPSEPHLPPFCEIGTDMLPQGPPPGSPASLALAAWEVLTGARVARSAGSGRMSSLARHARDNEALRPDRMIWIALHAFDGADERWALRRARRPGLTDAEIRTAVVQEMGGPAVDPDEMTTLGFWRGEEGFYFDCRGPCLIVICPDGQRRRIGPAALVAAARRLLGFGAGPAGRASAARWAARSLSGDREAAREVGDDCDAAQLLLL